MKTSRSRPSDQGPKTRRSAGRASPRLLVALLLVGVAAGAAIYFVYQYTGDEQSGQKPDPKPATKDPDEINNKLAALQQEFQTVMAEDEALPRMEDYVRRFTNQYPDEPGGFVLLAQVQMRQAKWATAYQSWLRALESDPQVFELCKMAGFCAARLGRLDKAEQHYQDAVRAAGSAADSDVHAALGRLYLSMNEMDLAEQAFHRALKAPGPGEETNWKHEGYSGLANVAAMRRDFDTAIEHIDTALRLANSDSKADVTGYRIQKARIYMDANRDEDAVTMLAYTWSEDPDSRVRIESARLRAKLFERAGQPDKAVNHVAFVCDYHQRDPNRQDIVVANFYALLAEWQIKAGQTEAARISLDNVITLAPGHPQLSELRKKLNP